MVMAARARERGGESELAGVGGGKYIEACWGVGVVVGCVAAVDGWLRGAASGKGPGCGLGAWFSACPARPHARCFSAGPERGTGNGDVLPPPTHEF